MTFPEYNGVELVDFEVDALRALEQMIGEPLPVLRQCDGGNFGFKPLDFLVDALAVNYKDLTALPSGMKDLHALTQLYLNFNQLIDVTECFDGLFSVKHIEITCNKLTSLPANIKDMDDLEHLDVEYNQLTELPPEIAELPKLTYLNAGHNKLERIPSSLPNLSTLESLSLSCNALTTLPESIENMHALRKIDLSDNRISGLPESILSLQLEALALSGNPILENNAIVLQLKERGCQVSIGDSPHHGKSEADDRDKDTQEFFRSLWD